MKDKFKLLEKCAEFLEKSRLQTIFYAVHHHATSAKRDLEIAAISIGIHQDYLDDESLPVYIQDYCLLVLARRIKPPDLPTIMKKGRRGLCTATS